MKLSNLLGAVAMFSSAHACIRIHTLNTNNPVGHDAMKVQIWDNDDFYEVQEQQKSPGSASSDTHWGFQFSNGHYVEVWDNGRHGRVALQNGWAQDFQSGRTQNDKECILYGENYCKLSQSRYESCMNDGFGNCGQYSCDLCDYDECRR